MVNKIFGVLVGLIFLCLSASSVFAAEFYVSPDGGVSGSGTQHSPWDFASAINKTQTEVPPGSTIWVDEGTYKGKFTINLQGSTDQYTTLRAMPGKRVTLDGGVTIAKEWFVLWGFEITNSDPLRVSQQTGSAPTDIDASSGIATNSKNIKVINNIIHDAHGNGIASYSSGPQEWYGNIIYNVGWTAPDRGHGHTIYTHNNNGGSRLYENNISLPSTSGFNLHLYSASVNQLRDYTFLNHISAYKTDLIGGGGAAINTYIRDSAFYKSYFRMGYDTGSKQNEDLHLYNNYIANVNTSLIIFWKYLDFQNNTFFNKGQFYALVPNATVDPKTFNINNNTYYTTNVSDSLFKLGTTFGPVSTIPAYTFADWKTTFGFDSNSTLYRSLPPDKIFIYPNKYKPQSAHIAIYNWSQSSSVQLDLSTLNLTSNKKYVLRNAHNYYDQTMEFTYASDPVELNMTSWSAAIPIGLTQPLVQTTPEFGVFVVEPLDPSISSSPNPSLKPGDANNDNKVDGIDYIIWLNHYGQQVSGPANGDFNSDNKVDGIDYVIWLNNYGK